MKLLYKPFGIVLSLLAGFVAKKIFNVVWGLVDDAEPPKPTTQQTSWPKVLGAAAVQGMTFKVVKAAVDRSGARGFEFLTGAWPGPKQPEKSQAGQAIR